VRRIRIDPDRPEPRVIDEAVRSIRAGAVIAVPTDTLYGLAVDPFDEAAVARLFAAKGRSADIAVPLIAGDTTQVREHLGSLFPLAQCLVDRYWPGPLTLLLPAPTKLVAGVTAGTGKVGVRVPAHAVARALCAAAGVPLTATSANLSGTSPSANPDDIVRALDGRIDLLLDAGITPGGPASTIVDVTGEAPRLVRAGAISWEEIDACANGAS
jgi:L-threonylcarbamoyladenylate synthase